MMAMRTRTTMPKVMALSLAGVSDIYPCRGPGQGRPTGASRTPCHGWYSNRVFQAHGWSTNRGTGQLRLRARPRRGAALRGRARGPRAPAASAAGGGRTGAARAGRLAAGAHHARDLLQARLAADRLHHRDLLEVSAALLLEQHLELVDRPAGGDRLAHLVVDDEQLVHAAAPLEPQPAAERADHDVALLVAHRVARPARLEQSAHAVRRHVHLPQRLGVRAVLLLAGHAQLAHHAPGDDEAQLLGRELVVADELAPLLERVERVRRAHADVHALLVGGELDQVGGAARVVDPVDHDDVRLLAGHPRDQLALLGRRRADRKLVLRDALEVGRRVALDRLDVREERVVTTQHRVQQARP